MSIRPSARFLDLVATSDPIPSTLNPQLSTDPTPAAGDRIEIRYETYSPVEEYATREGRTEPLHEEFHALLSMDYKGSGTVTADGIKIKEAQLVGYARRKVGVTFWHPDSNLCNQLTTGPVKVNYTFNPARPHLVHLWDLQWRYLESLPEKTRVPFLDTAGLADASKAAKRQIKRLTDHLQDLHHDDSQRAIDQQCHNAAAMDRVAVQLPLPAASEPVKRETKRTATEQLTSFDRAERDTTTLIASDRRTQSLRDAADRDHVAISSQRRSLTPTTATVHDPLDDL